jgi:hypothetical protein
VERGLALLRGLAERLDATAPSIGLLAVRNPLGGAARLHLRLLAGETLDRVELHQAMARHADGLHRQRPAFPPAFPADRAVIS